MLVSLRARRPTAIADWRMRFNTMPHARLSSESSWARRTWPKIEEYRQFLAPKLAPVIGRELAADLLWVQVLVYYGNYDSDYHYLTTFLDNQCRALQ